MSCCGQKRNQWLAEQKQLQSNGIIDSEMTTIEVKENPPVLFEYRGRNTLKVQGLHTGETYLFHSYGQQIHVQHEDSFSMMAEPDLIAIRKYSSVVINEVSYKPIV